MLIRSKDVARGDNVFRVDKVSYCFAICYYLLLEYNNLSMYNIMSDADSKICMSPSVYVG